MNKSTPIEKKMKKPQLEGKFELLLEFAPDAVVVVDKTGEIILINAKAEEIFAYPRDELIGQSVELLVPESSRDMHVKHRDVYTGKPETRSMSKEFDLTGRRKDGSTFPAEISLSPLKTQEGVFVTSIIRDVSDRKQAENEIRRLNLELEQRVVERTTELQQMTERAEGYLDVAGVVILVIDKKQNVTLINKKGCEILGYRQSEILGKNWFDHFIPKNKRVEVKAVFNKMMLEEVPPVEYFQNAVLTKTKNERMISWHNAVLRDDNGKIVATLSSGEDITEKDMLEQKVRHAEKLAAVGQLTSGLAHEIGTPLGVISGRADFMLRKMSKEDPLRDNLERIIKQIERITRIVQQLLSFTRPKPISVRSVNIARMLKDTFLLFEHQFTKQGVETSIDSPDNLPMTMADPDQIQQVCLNLIMNAVQAMPEGGKLRIRACRTSSQDHTDNIVQDGLVEDGHIKIEISDTGEGISSENLNKIFLPFYSTKEPGKGTGLGLNISESIVNNHGGWIDVKSQIGKGTVFTVFLPIKANIVEKGRG